MHYIKFLKIPSLIRGEKKSASIKTVVAVTTDLGDDYFPYDLLLDFEVFEDRLGKSSKKAITQSHHWRPGMRALPVELRVSGTHTYSYTLHIKASNSSYSTEFSFRDGILATPSVMPVISPPFGHESKTSLDLDVVRPMPMTHNHELSIYESTGDSIARHIWDGSVAFCGLIDHASVGKSGISVLDKAVCDVDAKGVFSVIELGAGVGLAGLALARVMPKASVLLTDVPEVEALLARSIAANKMDPTNVTFEVLDWEQEISSTIAEKKFDMIIVSECTYNEDSIPALVNVLSQLMSKSAEAVILVATKQRHENERIFYDLMKKADFVLSEQTHAVCPRNFTTDDPEDVDSVNIYTFRLAKD
jgi:predicted nicotinamide N-methyase